VLVRADGPVTEPHSTSDIPDKIIILFRRDRTRLRAADRG
jgi:hypothetical protein